VRSLDAQFLGMIGLERQGHSVAITIMSNGRMPGFGRKVSVPIVETLFAQPGVRRVWAYCHVGNTPVQRVLARMGAEREGCLRKFAMFPNLSDEPQDVYVYAIVR
jgi:RimJ/RimL family protein N-acetyltransferase